MGRPADQQRRHVLPRSHSVPVQQRHVGTDGEPVLVARTAAALAAAAGLLLSACSVPLTRPAAAGGTAPLANCTRGGTVEPNGGMSCVGGQEYRCDNGAWKPTALRCEP